MLPARPWPVLLPSFYLYVPFPSSFLDLCCKRQMLWVRICHPRTEHSDMPNFCNFLLMSRADWIKKIYPLKLWGSLGIQDPLWCAFSLPSWISPERLQCSPECLDGFQISQIIDKHLPWPSETFKDWSLKMSHFPIILFIVWIPLRIIPRNCLCPRWIIRCTPSLC